MADPRRLIESRRFAVLLVSSLLVTGIAVLGTLPVTGHVGGGGGVGVTIVETNEPVAEGDTLNVTVELENTAEDPHTIRAVLYVGGGVRDSESVNLASGESTTVTLTWETESGDAGDYEAAVEVGDDYDTTPISVRSPPNLSIEIDETNSPIVEGEALAVTATVENSGGMPVTAAESLVIDEVIRDTTTVSIDGNATQTLTLTWATEAGDAGTYDISARVGNATARSSIGVEAASENESVNEAPHAAIITTLDGEAVETGTTVEFEADASDPDGAVANFEWRIDGEVVSTEQVFSYTYEEAGTHEVRLIVTDDDGSPTAVARTIHVVAPDTTTAPTGAPPTTTSGQSGPGFGVVLTLSAVSLFVVLRRVV